MTYARSSDVTETLGASSLSRLIALQFVSRLTILVSATARSCASFSCVSSTGTLASARTNEIRSAGYVGSIGT